MSYCILEADAADFSYGGHHVLHEVSLKIPQASYVSLVGPNGSGKSTLLRLLCGTRNCQRGTVFYQGKDITRMGISKRARQFAVVRQNEENRFPFTCLEMVILGLHPHRTRFGRLSQAQMTTVREVMERTETLSLCDQPITQISGGEFQRVILARAIVQNPRVLFLDEAMSDCDIRVKIRLTKYLRDLIALTGMSVVAVKHDLAAAYQYSDQIIALLDGHVAAFGSPAEVMSHDFFASIFGVEAEIFDNKGFFIRDSIEELSITKEI